MLKLAVVGKDVSQSQSPKMHTFILERLGETCSYDRVSVPPEAFSERAEELFGRYDAFNVTIPFKTEILPFLRSVEGDALSFGAVNTVLTKDRTGWNTDGYGFLLLLQNADTHVEGRSVLLLGAGGVGRSCIKKLTEAGADVFVYERDEARLDAVYREFGGFTPLKTVPVRPYDVVINATGIGMHDTVGKTPEVRFSDGIRPVDAELLAQCKTAVELIYVPAETQFLRIAKSVGAKTVGGAPMLFYQAYRADCIYLNREPNAAEAKLLWERYRKEESI